MGSQLMVHATVNLPSDPSAAFSMNAVLRELQMNTEKNGQKMFCQHFPMVCLGGILPCFCRQHQFLEGNSESG